LLRLLGARHDAAIVIGKYDDGTPLERGVEDPLAGDIEIVDVHQRDASA
jgi:hypothetical protein